MNVSCVFQCVSRCLIFRFVSQSPDPLYLVVEDGVQQPDKTPSGKVCADVVEALIGLVYTEFGIDACRSLISDMGLIPPFHPRSGYMAHMGSIVVAHQKVEIASKFTGQDAFHNLGLIEEAFCHPTALGTRTPSYQRLEWIGDAALCLAAREWVYRKFPDRSVGDMVVTEALLDSNEALAYISKRKGLHKFLDHRDQTLQRRIDEYAAELSSRRGGLWGTAPPKPLADVVESLIGLVHVDCGFDASQQAARHILVPVLRVLESTPDTKILVHPKTRLKELAGPLLSIEICSGDSFSRMHPDTHTWNGYNWGPAFKGMVARIHCLGETIVATCGASKAAARTLACELVLAVIKQMPNFMERFHNARLLIQKDAEKSNEDADD